MPLSELVQTADSFFLEKSAFGAAKITANEPIIQYRKGYQMIQKRNFKISFSYVQSMYKLMQNCIKQTRARMDPAQSGGKGKAN